MLAALLMLAGGGVAQGQDAGPPYPPVLPGKALVFPQDLGAHPDYRTEWWYITGWLRDAAGVERGFQLTFFRVRTRIGEDNPSRFAPRQLVLAHAAVADPASGRLRHAERSGRAYPGLVEALEGRTAVRVTTGSSPAGTARRPDTAAASKRRTSASSSISPRIVRR